jgi:hypothetical protein
MYVMLCKCGYRVVDSQIESVVIDPIRTEPEPETGDCPGRETDFKVQKIT